MSKKIIDIREIIKEKNPNLLKWMPSFLINYVKKITHEDDINRLFKGKEDLKNQAFCDYVLKAFNINIVVQGLENIPKTGGAHFVCNHPLGGMDALSIVDVVSNIRKDIKFIVNDVLLNLKPLKDMFIGVNKHGSTAKASLLAVDKVLASENAVFVFPAGLVSRKKKGKVEDLEWKKTFVSRAKKHNKPVIPVYIDGELSNFFYKLANIRTFIGIKANIEMFYLINELFKQKGRTIKIVFGNAVPASHFDKSKKDAEWAHWMKEKTYALK